MLRSFNSSLPPHILAFPDAVQRVVRTIVSVAFMSEAASAYACPYCSSEIGVQVRSELFGGDFIPNLILISAPWLMLFAMVALWLIAPSHSDRTRQLWSPTPVHPAPVNSADTFNKQQQTPK